MLMCKHTNSFLAFDLADKITSADEAYACTTTTKDIGPCGRTVLFIIKVDEEDVDEVVRYGQQIRLVTNPYIL